MALEVIGPNGSIGSRAEWLYWGQEMDSILGQDRTERNAKG
jgi:hypothetical protein